MNYREKIRKAIECPQFGYIRYGEWGGLRLEQRIVIRRLLDELDSADEYIKSLYMKNEELKEQLKIQISSREEQYRELKETNKVLANELTKDKILKQNHLTTCCGIPIADIPKLIKKNKKLEDKLTETENWLRPAILQLMDFVKQDYYWITDQQINSARLVPIEFTVMGDRSVKFKKVVEE